jgi:hypothetical protein
LTNPMHNLLAQHDPYVLHNEYLVSLLAVGNFKTLQTCLYMNNSW